MANGNQNFNLTGEAPTLAGRTSGILGAGFRAGMFNPLGSDQLRAALRRRALRTARNRRRSGEVLGRLAGLGSQAQRQAFVDVDRAATGQRADFLNQAAENQLLGSQDFLRRLLSQERGFEFEAQQRELDRKMREEEARKGVLGGLGSIAGAGLGSFLGPLGTAAGQGLGRKLGGSYGG